MRCRSGWWAGGAAAILAFACGCNGGAAAYAWSGSTGYLTWAGSHAMVRVRRSEAGTKLVACTASLGCVVVRSD